MATQSLHNDSEHRDVNIFNCRCVQFGQFISPNEGVWPRQCFPLHTYGIITHVQCSYHISRNFGGTNIWDFV